MILVEASFATLAATASSIGLHAFWIRADSQFSPLLKRGDGIVQYSFDLDRESYPDNPEPLPLGGVHPADSKSRPQYYLFPSDILGKSYS